MSSASSLSSSLSSSPSPASPPPPPSSLSSPAAPPPSSSASSVESGVQSFLAAFAALHHGANPAVQQQANSFLTRFQEEAVAWQVSDAVLHRAGLSDEVYYNAATILRHKLLHSYHADIADATSRLSFRRSLLAHLRTFKASVLVYALVSDEWPNAVQELTTELGGEGDAAGARLLCDALSEGVEEVWEAQLPISHEDRLRAQRTLSAQLPFVLDLLLFTLQRAGEHRVLQKAALQCLCSWWKNVTANSAPVILRHPLVEAAFAAVQVAELEEVAGGCIGELIRLLESFCAPTSHHGVAQDAEDGLDEDGELISFSYTAPMTEEQLDAMHSIVDRVTALLPAYKASVSGGQWVRARVLCQAFDVLGEAFVRNIAQGMRGAGAVLECVVTTCSHPDVEVAGFSFPFWSRLSGELMALQHQQPNSGSGRAGGELSTALSASSSTSSSSPSPALASFLPYFRSLLQCLQVALRYPLDYSDWNEEQKDEHKKYRYQAADTLVDAVAVVGVRDTLHLLWASTTQHLVVYTQSAGQRWHELEASLHCFRAIGGRVSSEEGEVIPQLMAAVCSPSVVSPSAPFAVAYTALLLIGRYADWVNAHLHFLGPLLQLIVQALNHTPLQAAAAVAFKHTCDATSRHLAEDQAIAAAHIHPTQETAATPSSSSTSGPLSSTVPASTSSFLPALLSVYAASGSLPLTEQREIIGGMCDVVSVLDGARLSSMLQALLQPVVSALQAALSQPTASATQRQQVTAEVCLQLERLTCIIDGLEPARHEQPQLVRTALLHIAQHTWTLLTTAVQRLAEVERVLDMVGRAWRRLLKKTTPPPPPHHSSRPAHAAVNGTDVVAMQAHPPEHLFTPLLQPLLQTISQAYLQRPHASFLYVLSSAVDVFASQHTQQAALFACYQALVPSTLSVLSAPPAALPPDLVEDFFELSARVCSRMPLAVYSQPPPSASSPSSAPHSLLSSLLSCASACLLVHQREALSSVCHFLATVLSEGSDSSMARSRRGGGGGGGRAPSSPHQGLILGLLQRPASHSLLTSLLQSAAFDIAVHQPPHRLPALVDWLMLLTYTLPNDIAPHLLAAFAPYTAPPPTLRSSDAPALLTTAQSSDFVSTFTTATLSVAHAAPYAVKDVVRKLKQLIERFGDTCRRRVIQHA